MKEALNAPLNSLFRHKLGFLSNLQAEMAGDVGLPLLGDDESCAVDFGF